MIRRIIEIDEEKCNGCGLCAKACHEGAIGMVDGKAKLLRDDYCDGLGDCLPACPMDAISFVEREAAAYNEAAVLAAKQNQQKEPERPMLIPSRLRNFPIQIKLAPVNAPWFDGADLLIAADCTAYCYGNFHNDFIRDKVTLIACPKLDMVNYAEKLTQIFANNAIRSVTVARMTVPCCGGLPFAVKTALENCGKEIPLNIVTISPDGRVIR
jgi:NAD-dependent dihydropyrimidine dehydrogenase PreA subunit